MSLKLEKLQEKVDQAVRAHQQAQKQLAPLAEARKAGEDRLLQAEAEESEKTRRRQEAHAEYQVALAAEQAALRQLTDRATELQRWQRAFDAALEE